MRGVKETQITLARLDTGLMVFIHTILSYPILSYPTPSSGFCFLAKCSWT